MSLEKKESLGTVKVSKTIFASVVIGAAGKTTAKVIFASKTGRILGGLSKRVSPADLLANMDFEEQPDAYILTFYVVLNFGDSIGETSRQMLDYIEKELKALFPGKALKVTFKLVGIKSKKFAKRDVEIVREYEPAR